MAIKNIQLMFLLMLVASSCQKWKEPTEVGFYLDIAESSALNNQLTFTGGQLVMANFEFDGDRQKGDDVYFSKDYEDGIVVPFDEDLKIDALDFVIPQGVYKKLDIRFKTSDNVGDFSLILNANYMYTGGGSVAVRFELEGTESFEATAEAKDGGDIILDKDVYSPAKIILNPSYWFEPVPVSSFESAAVTDLNGVNTIVIGKDDNEDIYNLVLDRVDESVQVIFNF